MPRYKLTIAYDGTDFCGWQKQEPLDPAQAAADHADQPWLRSLEKHTEEGLIAGTPGRIALRTVAAVVERAVREIVREPVVLKGASRTDSGVHALGQVAAFTCSGDEDPAAPSGQRGQGGWPVARGLDRLVHAINSRLPEDVLVSAAEPVAPDFDPVRGATSKAYSYTIQLGRTRPLWDRGYVYVVHDKVDVSAMERAARDLVGEHDFVAFAAAGHGRLSTVRTIFDCQVVPVSASRLRIDVCGSGFLYNMVRIIAGTLIDVGRGRIARDAVPTILAGKDRTKAGPTLPAHGLRLEWIRYDGARA